MFVKVLYGAPYAPGASVLKIHIWPVVFGHNGTAAPHWCFAEKTACRPLSLAFVRALACLALDHLLRPPFGPMGAAWALLLANAPAILLRFAYPSIRPTTTIAPARHGGTLISRSCHA